MHTSHNGLKLVSLVVVITIAAGCGGPAAEPTTVASKPVVTILAPANASQLAANQPVTIQMNGTDAQGVTRIEIKVDGVLIATAQGQGAQGQPSLDAVQQWTFGQAGSHVITGQAYNAAGQIGDIASVTVLVTADSSVTVPVGTPGAATGEAPTAAAVGPAETLQPCTLVTADEAAAIMGEASGPSQEVNGGCAFTNAANSLYTVSVGAAQGTETEGMAQALVFVLGMAGVPLDEAGVSQLRALAQAQDWPGFFNQLSTMCAGAANVKAQLLEGVGDAGFWAWISAGERMQGALAIARGDTLVNINLVVAASQQEDAMLQAATELAEKVFSRLPARFTLPTAATPGAAPTITSTVAIAQVTEAPTTAPTTAAKPPTATPTNTPKPPTATPTNTPKPPTPVPPPVIVSFTADPASITAGGSTTLSWQVTGATKMEIDQGVGKIAANGSKQVSPAGTIIYKLTAANGSAIVTAQVTVNVNPPAGPKWGGWEKIGGVFTLAPTVASWNENRLDVFVRGTNTHLMHRTWKNNDWGSWEDLGGVLIDSPGCVSWGAKRIDCFVRGQDQELWHQAYSGGVWAGFDRPGGVYTYAPTVASWAENRLDVFVRGTNTHLMHRWWAGGWSGWEDLGGVIADSPACVSWDNNRIDCFARGSDSELWHQAWNGVKWEGWDKVGGVFTLAPTVASWAPNRLDVFVRGTNTHLMHRWWAGSGWSGWEDLGGVLSDAPACVSRAANRIDCFVRGTDSELWHLGYGQ